MRSEFLSTLFDLASNDPKIILITADLGFSVFEEYESKYPLQYLNVGVSEQNMIGVAGGLALDGWKPFCYSIGNFPTLRCLEQIRNILCYHSLNVTIVGMGAGFSYGSLGFSHHATEDLSILSAVPNLDLFVPTNSTNVSKLMREACVINKPSYLRLDKSYSDSIDVSFLGRNEYYLDKKEGNIVIISIGGISEEAIHAQTILHEHSLSISLCILSSFNLECEKRLANDLSDFDHVYTLEENTINGGLGSYIALLLSTHLKKSPTFHSFAIKSGFTSFVGSQQFLRKSHHIDSQSIVEYVLKNHS